IRPNRKLITRDHYSEKVEKYASQWPVFNILPPEDVESCAIQFPDVFNIVYGIVYEANNRLFVRFLSGNALSKQSLVHAFVKTNAPILINQSD
ncbi:MAG: hypothetical protein V3V52_02385, partial [Candidatus Adiutricales bacterium]